MTIEDLKDFVALYQTRNVSDAAVELLMTQSALSKRIHAMEDELTTKLISTKNKRHLVITESGEVFFRYAETILTQYDLLTQELSEYRELKKGTLHIGSVPVMSQYGLMTKMSQFMADYPQINIRLEELEGVDLLEKLQSKQLDLGILRNVQTQLLNKSQFHFIDIDQDELKVVLPANHRLAKQDQISIEDLRDIDVVVLSPGSGIYERIGKLYQQAGFTPNIRFTTTHIETLMGIIENSQRVTFLFQKSAEPFMSDKFVTRSFSTPIYNKLQLVYPQGTLTQAGRRFINYITHASQPIHKS
ncbi:MULTISPECIES: LysR family transcriptional regulator [Pediococcus]|jgi:DNA-binding transcriptional LysR family regulator|uniref:LysR family transcriptional regulator n=1 Tax=Pediococcus TaxID=1253 RepID=UPI000E8BDE18|nr:MULTISPECIES: LysR family transcriptional regulator [Pediococcus]MCT3029821.1 LysR family transcriptional regulator [Pediococcus parvulus]MCT3035699.1 LysR family transcriptional regulator [Pediococcus parvulus]MDN5575602.1 LysR family transcriptional regulator [Pediococcus sp.]HBO47171.1 transcriptional regulator [Pediococcus sp.]